MQHPPRFPHFKNFELKDRDLVQSILERYQPQTSELTFTNLFMWRHHYGSEWCLLDDWLIILNVSDDEGCYALPPVGPQGRGPVVKTLLEWLGGEKILGVPLVQRADAKLAEEVDGLRDLQVEATPDHYDYVYETENLVKLAGRKYHSKRNFINTFLRTYRYRYETLTPEHIPGCLDLAACWCRMRRCEEDMDLMGELRAIHEVLENYGRLGLEGGVILVDGRVEAFSLGELLNADTAVIHIEKANPELRGIYALINQQFCEHQWSGAAYINREQDLGEPGLRKAKQSYYPSRMVEKYRIRLSGYQNRRP
jgi:hypothetical protein